MDSVLDLYISEEDPDALLEMVKAGVERAKKGDFRFWQAIYERLDGKVASKVEVTNENDRDIGVLVRVPNVRNTEGDDAANTVLE